MKTASDPMNMPHQPLLSVVVPTFNDGELLERCLRSIMAAAVPSIEVVVVDDGSDRPEALAGIARATALFPDARLVRIGNAGPSAARNRGLAESRGRWVAFVDADDEVAPGGLAARLALAGDDLAVAATYGSVIFVEPDGSRRMSGWMTGRRPLPVDRIGDRDGVPGFLWAYLVRSDVMRALGGMDESLRIMEDFDLLARLGGSGALVVGGAEPACIQHRRPGSLARGSARRQAAGALRFLAKARREGYFSRGQLLRRYLRVPLAAAKIVLRYRRR